MAGQQRARVLDAELVEQLGPDVADPALVALLRTRFAALMGTLRAQ